MNTSKFRSLILPDANPIAFYKIEGLWKEEYDLLPDRIKAMYIWEEKTHTYKLPNEEWLKWRNHGPFYYDPSNPNYVEFALGGSDVSTLFDGSVLSEKLSRYEGQHGNDFKCTLELFHQKLGLEPEISLEKDEDILWIGHNYEEAVANTFVRRYQQGHKRDTIVMWKDQRMFRCGQRDKNRNLKYGFALADLDFLIKINGHVGVLEIKTTRYNSEVAKLFRKGICPLKYELQVRYYLAITNLPYAFIYCAWGLDMTEGAYIYIERDLGLEKDIMNLVGEFINCLKEKREPDWRGQNTSLVYNYLRRIQGFVNEDLPAVELSSEKKYEALALLQIAQDTEDRKKEQSDDDKEARKILSNIVPYMGKSTKATIAINDKQYISLRIKDPVKRAKVDEDRLLQENPALYQAYCCKFDSALFKLEHPLEFEEYSKKASISEEKAEHFKVTLCTKKGGR